jgi:hypothetical protein
MIGFSAAGNVSLKGSPTVIQVICHENIAGLVERLLGECDAVSKAFEALLVRGQL